MNEPDLAEVNAAVRAVLNGKPRGAPARWEREFDTTREASARSVHHGRLLGLKDAESLGHHIREVCIAPGTVVTPLARDYLKRSGVGLRITSANEARSGQEGESRWGMVIEAGLSLGLAVRRSVLTDSGGWEDLGEELEVVSRWVATGEGRGGVAVLAEPSVAVWRACRGEGVRAAWAGDVRGVTRACRHLGMNLLVIDATGQSIYSIGQLMKVFQNSGTPKPPGWLGGSFGEGRTCGSEK